MKILLSAHACDPRRGSELAVGWNWAIRLARRGHEVWVITHSSSRDNIDSYLNANDIPNLHFRYYHVEYLPTLIGRTKLGYYFRYLLWQWEVYLLAKEMHAGIRFDCVHHVTFASVRIPSFMGLLGIPFIFGPVGGGESATWSLLRGFPLNRFLGEITRALSNQVVRVDPLLRWATLSRADKIIVTTHETRDVLPRKFRGKSEVRLAIGIDLSAQMGPRQSLRHDKQLRLLYAGNLFYHKGIHLALRTFARFKEGHPESRFTLIGSGRDSTRLHHLAESLAINDAIEWIPRLERPRLLEMYRDFDVLLFPVIHDSGGMVVLEALANGLPVICLDLGGPGTIVNESCGRVIPARGNDDQQIVQKLAAALNQMTAPNVLQEMRMAAIARAHEFSWESLLQHVYPAETSCKIHGPLS